MSKNLFNGNDIILDNVEEALLAKKNNFTINYAKIKYFAKVFKKEAGSKFQISKFGIESLVQKTCNKCDILGKDPDVIKKIFKG